MTQRKPWQKVGVLGAGRDTVERFWQAGLSTDGNRCLFSADTDGYSYGLYSRIDDKIIPDYAEFANLGKWQKDDFIEVETGVAKGRYRLFGIFENHPLEINEVDGLHINVDLGSKTLILSDATTNQEVQRLKYDGFSGGEWAYATFSDDCNVIAVMEPHYITFFARV